MKRILGLLAVFASLVIAACGGVQSPDFLAQLKGLQISAPIGTTTTVINSESVPLVTPGGTLQLSAVGLFTTPPGSGSDTATGSVDGVQWSSSDPTIASVDPNSGLVKGLKRSATTVTITAAKSGVASATKNVAVDGTVLQSISVTAAPTSVPNGDIIALTATTTCQKSLSSGGGTTTCSSPDTYQYTWQLVPGSVGAGVFPASGSNVATTQGVKTINFKTTAVGALSVSATVVNEEGTSITGSGNATVAPAVIRSVKITGSSSLSNGLPGDYAITATYSDGHASSSIQASDLQSAFQWTTEADNAARGKITVPASGTTGASPNSSIRVTGARVGPTTLTATATSSEGKPLTDTANLTVSAAVLNAVTAICSADTIASATACKAPFQIPHTVSIKFKVRGLFSDNSVQEIPADQFDWSKVAASGDVSLDAETAASIQSGQGVTGVTRGNATLTAALKSTSSFAASVPPGSSRVASVAVVVIDDVCANQFFDSAAAPTTATAGGTATPPSSASLAGNVIDNDPTTFGQFKISAALTDSTLTMTFNRPSVTIDPGTGTKTIGVRLNHDANFNPSQQMVFGTIDSSGNPVQSNVPVSESGPTTRSIPGGGSQSLFTAKGQVNKPFTGMTITVKVPNVLAITPISGGQFDPSFLNTLIAILGGGGTINVGVDDACADLR